MEKKTRQRLENCFSTNFQSKTPKNHDKLIHGIGKKTTPKTKINQKPKFKLSSYMSFQGLSRQKKTLNINSHNQLEPFDTNIDCFSSLDRYQ